MSRDQGTGGPHRLQAHHTVGGGPGHPSGTPGGFPVPVLSGWRVCRKFWTQRHHQHVSGPRAVVFPDEDIPLVGASGTMSMESGGVANCGACGRDCRVELNTTSAVCRSRTCSFTVQAGFAENCLHRPS